MKTIEKSDKILSDMTACVHNLGCKVNQYESDAMGQMLKEAGAKLVPFGEGADICVINTCSVTNTADQKSRQMISRARRKNPDAVVVAAGCFIQTNDRVRPSSSGADILIGNNEKSRLIELIDGYIKTKKPVTAKVSDTNSLTEYEDMCFSTRSGHTRAFVKVEDGCNDFCSYCIIPYARGRVRSRRIDDVVSEADKLAASGYRELVISGIHLPSFGRDTGESLLDLLRAVHGIADIKRIRLGSLEPGIITEEFASELCKLDKIAPHFHLSLQSGCDAVLKRMNRRYTVEEYRKKCGLLREVFCAPALTTDVIAGFPGESEEEFEESYDFVRSIGFYEMHVFKFSRRKGTPADRMDGQIEEKVKAQRSKRLIELSKEMSRAYIESQKNTVDEVILEDEEIRDGVRGRCGFTSRYIKAFVPGEHEQGEIVRVTL